MIEYEEIYDKEKIENDKYKSMRELSKYTKLLNKGDNLSFILNNNHQIKIKNAKSLFKISLLLGNLPEENVSFTFYTEEEDDEQSEEINSKKNILRGSKKVSLSAKKTKTNEIRNDYDLKEKKLNLIYLTDKIKDSIAQEIYKNGNIIGSNYNLYKKIWINLYNVALIISLSSLIPVFIYSIIILKEKKYSILGADGISLISLILMIFTSISGNKKMKSKKKVNFTKENYLLLTFILMSILCLGIWVYLYNNITIGLYLFIVLGIYFIFGLLLLMSLILIYLNIKMIDFYKEYHTMVEDGTLLIEVQ
jgi:hypothetical protein